MHFYYMLPTKGGIMEYTNGGTATSLQHMPNNLGPWHNDIAILPAGEEAQTMLLLYQASTGIGPGC
jgi:hypothetical protein